MRFPSCRFFSLLLGLFFATHSAYGADSAVLRVCADPINPPFSMKDGKGFENEIAGLLSRELGQRLEYTWFPQRMGFVRNTLKARREDNEQEWKCDVVMGVPTGWEQVVTTRPYYISRYAVLYNRKARALATLKDAGELPALLDGEEGRSLKIAMFDQGTGTAWLHKHGLTDRAIPYLSMTGDAQVNTAMMLLEEFLADRVDLVIVWGPIAAHVAHHAPKGTVGLVPLPSEEGVRSEFPISMGVRPADVERKQALDAFIAQHQDEIHAVLKRYGVPLAGP